MLGAPHPSPPSSSVTATEYLTTIVVAEVTKEENVDRQRWQQCLGRSLLIPLNQLLNTLWIWPNLCVSVKRIPNHSKSLNPTKSGELTHLLHDALLPFLECCFPCTLIGDVLALSGVIHLLRQPESNYALPKFPLPFCQILMGCCCVMDLGCPGLDMWDILGSMQSRISFAPYPEMGKSSDIARALSHGMGIEFSKHSASICFCK
ncbi:hypothetical protein Lal_00047733 [Lupinus albus]|nr:hypothetical protein Lal_00047733 [Lupinus albus]